ncbi:MAG: protein TolQ [Deltaproteobacteria bacterium]|nr:protein TolQ [Deltaproteobacteria bacterium]MBQ6669190.1 protein TolQ [Deltaproteobacteria bacterium]MBR5346876.1 protein TolQ [Deltaproteobacteria bacterium]MBR5704918.1 protein TolQ [Deltaproteobacteria bacterium]
MEIILNAGPVVKVVMGILIYLSVVSWAIIFHKWLVVGRARKASDGFMELFWTKKNFEAINQNLRAYAASPLCVLFREGYQELLRARRVQASDSPPDDFPMGTDYIARALRRAMTSETQRLERFLPFLATTGSTAPFIGLFGTVWGIMDSFHNIGQSGSASLAVVAPGISEALIATAIGLVAAVPAVIGYNHFSHKIDVIVGEMDNFSQEFLNILERMQRRA